MRTRALGDYVCIRMEGIVKVFKREGWGYIQGDEGVDYWVHASAILAGGVGELMKGDAVTFEPGAGDKGPIALNVRVEPRPRVLGIVNGYSDAHGSGTIVGEDGVQYGVTRENLTGTGYRSLAQQERVTFEPGAASSGRPLALRVSSPPGRLSGEVKSFDFAKGFGWITTDDTGQSLFFHFSQILQTKGKRTAEPGERVEFEVGETHKGLQAQAIKRLDPRLPLFRFASLGPTNQWLDDLAAVARVEPWDEARAIGEPSEPSGQHKPILWSYLVYTFSRLDQEAKTSPDKIVYGSDGSRKYACFNTGLVTPLQEEIFAFFEDNRTGVDGTPWKLTGFMRGSDKRLLSAIPKHPKLAQYYDDPSVLIYDRRRDLHIGVDHILEDNLDRFPAFCQRVHLARTVLHQAKTDTQQRVYRNYKTAIPQFYRGTVQLLLPLCLETPERADLALVVSRQGESYRGDTVLTIPMAYRNARLLTRPDDEWLTP